jgi:6-oxo-cyclohex-1-ene-carbonyl-CoA hydrolase
MVYGESKSGEELKAGKELLAKGMVDLGLLDEAVDELCAKFVHMFPECLSKTLEELRKPKLNAWNANKESSRAWLALNMMTEARAGFRAFNEPAGGEREIDFIALRLALADGQPWTDELTESLLPAARVDS